MFEIYVKKKYNRCWELAIEVPNAWGGMPHLWMFLEKKYLPSYVPVDEDGKPLNLECLKAVADECGGNYPLQYQALSGYVKTHSIRNIEAIAFNQTSVNCASDFFGEKYEAPVSKFWDCMFFKDVYSKIRKQKMSKLNEIF